MASLQPPAASQPQRPCSSHPAGSAGCSCGSGGRSGSPRLRQPPTLALPASVLVQPSPHTTPPTCAADATVLLDTSERATRRWTPAAAEASPPPPPSLSSRSPPHACPALQRSPGPCVTPAARCSAGGRVLGRHAGLGASMCLLHACWRRPRSPPALSPPPLSSLSLSGLGDRAPADRAHVPWRKPVVLLRIGLERAGSVRRPLHQQVS